MGSTNSYVGLGTIIGGLAAQITLYRPYSSTLVIREDHQLVMRCIYQFGRHPIYLGTIIGVILGIPVFTASFCGFLVLTVLILVVLKRIRMEEELLIEEFEETYPAYRGERAD